MTNPAALSLRQPLDLDDARVASRRLAEARRNAESDLERAVVDAATAEARYRQRLAEAFVQVANTPGTAAQKEAEARSAVAGEASERDIKHGMVKAYTERLRGLEGERSMLKSLIDWSSRMRLDE